MATTVFNLAAVDRIEADVKAMQAQLNTMSMTISTLSNGITSLTKIITDVVTSLGGIDQPAIDAVAADLRNLTATLSATAGRDKDT